MSEAKDSALKLLCKHGFSGDKKKLDYNGMPVIIKEDDNQKVIFGCNPENGEIDEKLFVSKVIFYLWNDVFKDYAEDGSPLLKYKKNEEDKSESDLTFPDFFDQSGEIDKNVVKQFIEKVMKEDDMDKSAE